MGTPLADFLTRAAVAAQPQGAASHCGAPLWFLGLIDRESSGTSRNPPLRLMRWPGREKRSGRVCYQSCPVSLMPRPTFKVATSKEVDRRTIRGSPD